MLTIDPRYFNVFFFFEEGARGAYKGDIRSWSTVLATGILSEPIVIHSYGRGGDVIFFIFERTAIVAIMA